MEIAGADGSLCNIERLNLLGFDVNDPTLILDWSGDLKKSAAGNTCPLALEYVRGNDDVGDSCLIFKREKNKSLCYAWALPSNNSARYFHGFMIARARLPLRSLVLA